MSPNQPEISVIMSVYNNAPYLKEAVGSILNQTFSRFEFLIIDDCSTDGSSEILREFAAKDKRIILTVNEENRGLTKNLNSLVKQAKGRYIARFDGDDISLPDRLEKSYQALEENPEYSLLCTGVKLMTEDGKSLCRKWTPRTGEEIWKRLPDSNYVTHPSVMGRAELFKENPYDESFRTGQDRNLWNRLKKKEIKFFFLDEILLNYRLNPNSVRKIWKSGGDYQYFLACVYMNNRCKMGALKYLSHIDKSNILKFLARFFTPISIMEMRRKKRKAKS